MIDYVRAHLAEHPREVGGDSRGPWVRLNMNGHEGKDWYWCAGFTGFCMKQTAETLGVEAPLEGSFSCDTLVAQAKDADLFLPEREARTEFVKAGYLFLSRKSVQSWTHVGIVTKTEAKTFESIEGNTNDAGDRNGYEVCARNLGIASKDFIEL